jgi:hypothetical protein
VYAPCALGGTLNAETISASALPHRRGEREQPARRERRRGPVAGGWNPVCARLRDQRGRCALRLGYGVAPLRSRDRGGGTSRDRRDPDRDLPALGSGRDHNRGGSRAPCPHASRLGRYPPSVNALLNACAGFRRS